MMMMIRDNQKFAQLAASCLQMSISKQLIEKQKPFA
jgi:hypothetical protein